MTPLSFCTLPVHAKQPRGGGRFYSQNVKTGTVAESDGVEAWVAADAGTITDGKVIDVYTTVSSGAITNAYDIYIEDILGTNQWGLYEAGADDKNYFAGTVGIGTVPSSSLLTVGANGRTNAAIALNGSTSGAVTIQPQAAAGTYNFNLPITVGGANQPLLSGGSGSAAMSWGTLTGTTTKFATSTGTLTSGNCAKWDASGNIVDAGTTFGGSGSGTVNGHRAPRTSRRTRVTTCW